ncbi:MAG TPA: signal peptidase I [Gaiellaceae bacterium]|nr:signal peptidase I [Gaiellaceae bacterium]
MDIPMQATTPAAEAPRPALRWAGPALSWLLLAAATVVVLGLAAITIGPRFLPYQALVVRSGSMSPTIPTGSVVFYRRIDAAKVKVGDVIVFAKPGQADEKVTHRVYQIGDSSTGRYFVTKGDANGAPDGWRVPAVGTGWIAAAHVPVLGYALADLQSPLGRLLLLVVPAILLGLITLYELVTERRGGARKGER